MKNKISILCLAIVLMATDYGYAQSLTLIPNPTGLSISSDKGTVYKDNMYYKYKRNINEEIYFQLGKYNCGEITLFENLDTEDKGFVGYGLVYNDTLFWPYKSTGHKCQLAKFYGNTYKLLNNPDTSEYGINNSNITCNNILYYSYINSSFKFQIAKYNGNSFSLIENPDTGTGFNSEGIIYKNELYFRYLNAASIYQLIRYDGCSLSLIDNPDEGIGCIGSRIVFNDNLYVKYINQYGKTQLAKYDGNSLTLIENPDNAAGVIYEALYEILYKTLIIYDNNLYCIYKNSLNTYQLAKYDGNSLALIANPDNGQISSSDAYNMPFVYKNELYLEYKGPSGNTRLIKYDGNKFTYIYDPDSANAYIITYPFIYNDNLYYQYRTNHWNGTLVEYDGSSLTMIYNPDTFCNYCGYYGNPIIYNNDLYIQYRHDSFIVQLARLVSTSDTKPINIITGSAGTQNQGSVQFSIYPNPATDRLIIEALSSENPANISLFDISGKKIMNKQLLKTRTEIDISRLLPGVYILQIENDTTVEIKRFIKI